MEGLLAYLLACLLHAYLLSLASAQQRGDDGHGVEILRIISKYSQYKNSGGVETDKTFTLFSHKNIYWS